MKSLNIVTLLIVLTFFLEAGATRHILNQTQENPKVWTKGADVFPPFPWWQVTKRCGIEVKDLVGYWRAVDEPGNTVFFIHVSVNQVPSGQQLTIRQMESIYSDEGQSLSLVAKGTGIISEDSSTVAGVMVRQQHLVQHGRKNSHWLYIHSLCEPSGERHTVVELVYGEEGLSYKFLFEKISNLYRNN